MKKQKIALHFHKRIFRFLTVLLSISFLCTSLLLSSCDLNKDIKHDLIRTDPVQIFGQNSEDVLSSLADKSISAESYCLMDHDTKEILASRNEHKKLPIASTTKIMTAVVVSEHISPDKIITVDRRAAGVEGSSVYLYQNERITVRDLLYALLLESANDAAEALAYGVCGSIERFADLMNEKAKSLGMENSHFVNPHGLYHEDHYSTAYDMALLTSFAMTSPLVSEIMATENYRATLDADKSEYRFFSNHNRLLKMYDDCIGGKTGFTKASGRCLATASCRDGKLLTAMTINAPDDWNDHIILYEYAFSLYKKTVLMESLEYSLEIPVSGGTLPSTFVTNLSSVEMPIKETDKISYTAELPRFLYAPVYGLDDLPEEAYPTYASQYIGRLIFNINDAEIHSIPLYITKSVPKKEKESFFGRLFKNK